jgi:hypothetical protein
MRALVLALFLATAAPEPEQVVAAYNSALESTSPSALAATIGESLFMFGGAGSTDPARWVSHMYLSGDGLKSWIGWFPNGAGPHRNTSRLRSKHIRGNSAIVVTLDTGSNKFRSWSDEEVVWLLRKADDGWRIIGCFLSDAKNPDSGA